MRLNDLRGAHVWILANGSIVWRISVRVEGWKSSGARRFCADVSWYGRQSDWHAHTVMMSVFEGGDQRGRGKVATCFEMTLSSAAGTVWWRACLRSCRWAFMRDSVIV
jgi:hypothetical protein